jgi:hypothetical protein
MPKSRFGHCSIIIITLYNTQLFIILSWAHHRAYKRHTENANRPLNLLFRVGSPGRAYNARSHDAMFASLIRSPWPPLFHSSTPILLHLLNIYNLPTITYKRLEIPKKLLLQSALNAYDCVRPQCHLLGEASKGNACEGKASTISDNL